MHLDYVSTYLSVRSYMLDHVAYLGRLHVALKAAQNLVSAACFPVDSVALTEAQVGRVGAIACASNFGALADSLFDFARCSGEIMARPRRLGRTSILCE